MKRDNRFSLFMLGLILVLSLFNEALAASFDCAKAASKTEKLICSDVELSQLDENLAATYKKARDNSQDKEALKADQLTWLKTVRRCEDGKCIKDFYAERIKILSGEQKSSSDNALSAKAKHPWKLIASGDEHTCVANDDEIKCWGNNNDGALNIPRKFQKITQLNSTWSSAVCAKDSAGWECWGRCDIGVCDIPGDYKDADKITPGASHVCGLKDGLVRCWGKNEYGQVDVPDDLNDVVDIAVNNIHSCAVIRDGSVRCWGEKQYNLISSAEALSNARKIKLGLFFSCILNKSNKIVCASSSEQKIEGFERFADVNYIDAGIFSVCLNYSQGQLSCIGGKIQDFNENLIKKERFFSVSVGRSHVCGLAESGIFCWGDYANEDPKLYKVPHSAEELVKKTLLSN